MTFNILLGLVGGVASVILTALPLVFSWYPSFQFERALIRKLYTEHEGLPPDVDAADLRGRVKN